MLKYRGALFKKKNIFLNMLQFKFFLFEGIVTLKKADDSHLARIQGEVFGCN